MLCETTHRKAPFLRPTKPAPGLGRRPFEQILTWAVLRSPKYMMLSGLNGHPRKTNSKPKQPKGMAGNHRVKQPPGGVLLKGEPGSLFRFPKKGLQSEDQEDAAKEGQRDALAGERLHPALKLQAHREAVAVADLLEDLLDDMRQNLVGVGRGATI